jgi:hypothetical protein
MVTPLVSYGYPFGILWLPLWYLMITPLVSYGYPFGILWLPLWYLMVTPLVSSSFSYIQHLFILSSNYLVNGYLSEYGDIDMLFIAL